MTQHLIELDGRFWRMLFTEWANDLIAPARAPEGRWHYNGQKALYLSATPEGCAVAIARYTATDDAPRSVYPLRVRSNRIVDLRNVNACTYFNIDTTHRTAEWQLERTQGLPASTWGISDRVRALGLDGMLYASRTDPSKTHLTLLRWDDTVVRADGDPVSPP